MNRQLKPWVYKAVIALGIIGLYTAAIGLVIENLALGIIGTALVVFMAFVHMDEEDKKQNGNGELK